ncbi:uncharacterized protein K02A2.6-like [Sabethes cyaneus]|uniref:uncharacterized protein K02A2.6-like n=1 Tax=Sabethes cyaneus TaxID=53552 RepID=UPI00237DB3DB|nr:uncharacterized protein K02A2.6-like [Sabethes cyaneus]
MSHDRNSDSSVQRNSDGGGDNIQESSLAEVIRQMSLQNNRLLTRDANTEGEFHYDPENGITFDRWFSKYEDLFRKDGGSLDDPAKVRLMLRSLSVPVHEKFLNYLLPAHPRDYTFDQVVDKLKSIFGQQKSLFSKRYDCIQLIKNDADDFVTYAGIVNRQCEDFELQRLSVNQFKSLIFICGLKSAKDTDVRTRLLAKLELEPPDTINLEGLVTECQRLSNLKHDTALIEKKQNFSSVQAVRNSKKKPGDVKSSGEQLPPSPCWQCGAMHFVKDCNFTKYTCKQCGKTDHKEGYCACSAKSQRSEVATEKKPKRKATQNRTKTIQTVNQVRCKRRFVTGSFNGRSCELQLDCGSDISVITEQTWKQIGAPATEPTNVEATTASGEPLELVGELTCSISINEETRQETCYITSVEDLNVVGLDWMDAFDLWSKPLALFCKKVNQSIVSPYSDQYFFDKFPEVFKDSLGHCTKTKIALHLVPNTQPVFRPKRPVPYHAIKKVDEELNRLQRLDIISPVDYSEWAAPIVVVKKPGGKIRICADYSTGLNAALESNHFPLPTPEDIFSKLPGSRIFSIIDLSDAYLQVEVDDESKKLLTINTHKGLYRFNRLAPGVKSAPGAFQQLMSTMILDLPGVEAFLDDVIVYSKTEVEHHSMLCKLFKRLREYGFNLRPEKCRFYQKEIKYLGLIVNADGIRPDPAKVTAIANMPAPTNVTALRSFLGAVNFYGKFVREMHTLRHPLDKLLKKDVKFNWNSECQHAFLNIKRVLRSNLLLTHYNPELDIIVAGDASKTGIGAVLLHRFPNGDIKAVAHASRTLNAAEQNYSQIEKEALALVFACVKFHRMLWGRKFTLQTDHQPLLKVFGSKKGIPVHTANRLQRWALTLLGYDFKVEYISTQNFGYADVLSRLIDKHVKPQEEAVIATVYVEADVSSCLHETLQNTPITFEKVRGATASDVVQ